MGNYNDLTFSGANVNRLFAKKITNIVKSSGLIVHPKKLKLYSSHRPKLITGVILNGNKMKVPNKQHKGIYEMFNELKVCDSEEELARLQECLIGKLNAAGQIENIFHFRRKTYIDGGKAV